jgi:hypothetical protein
MTRFLCAAFAAALAAPAFAGDFVPGGNAGALARDFALPLLGNSRVLGRGRSESQTTLDFTNEYVSEGQGNCGTECITLDGETARLRFDYRQGLGGGWDFTAGLPLLHHGGGFLDNWIQRWHGWFGLPNGGREFAQDGQYHYQYTRGGVPVLDVTQTGNCVGDPTLGLGRALGASSALRGMVKFASHASQPLCGGNYGGALWLDAALPLPAAWSGYLALGYSYNERGDVLPSMQRRGIPFGGLGLLVPITQSVRISVQVQGNGHLYEGSELSPLRKAGAPLTLGLSFRTSAHGTFELGFQEDPSVGGSPDFAAYLALGSGAL